MSQFIVPASARPGDKSRWSAIQLEAFTQRALEPQYATEYGFVPVVNMSQARAAIDHDLPQSWFNNFPGLLCPWRSALDDSIVYQLRPDRPTEDGDGRPKKYIWPNGIAPRLHAARLIPGHGTLILVEGTFQTAAVARYVEPHLSVVGMIGCWGWSHQGTPLPDLEIVEGREVVVILDADVSSNSKVYQAASELSRVLDLRGALSTKFVQIPGGA